MKVLVIRMSSLGDVILATAFLDALPEGTQVDWLVAKEFSFVLKGHPKINQLIVFDKKSGIQGWFKLIHELSNRGYDLRVDLHVTIRSQMARWIFHWMDLTRGYWVPWKQVSKQRFRFWGYLAFKGVWPRFLRPTPFFKRFSELGSRLASDSRGLGHPLMNHLVGEVTPVLSKYSLESKKYFVVMPSSRWPSKEWGANSYFELCRQYHLETGLIPVVLGRVTDKNANELIRFFQNSGVTHRSILEENDFRNTATLIEQSFFYVGSDTGLAHLAEAVGVRAIMIFGPTRPDLGFGPWRQESRSVYSDVWCSPCSKDGRTCFRLDEPYACLKQISVEMVRKQLP